MHGFSTKENVCEDGDEVGDVVDCSAVQVSIIGDFRLMFLVVVGSGGVRTQQNSSSS